MADLTGVAPELLRTARRRIGTGDRTGAERLFRAAAVLSGDPQFETDDAITNAWEEWLSPNVACASIIGELD